VTPLQTAALRVHFERFMRGARGVGLDDRAVGEWLLSLASRWLHAHGYTAQALHQWLQHEIERPAPLPLTAAAATRTDFGERR
jgi:hypothetical protein